MLFLLLQVFTAKNLPDSVTTYLKTRKQQQKTMTFGAEKHFKTI